MKRGIAALVAVVTFGLTVPTLADGGDATRGATVAKNKCGACHDLGDTRKNRVGPHLAGIANQPAGKVPDYKYSEAHLKAAADKKLVWDGATLDAYLKSPREFLPGNRMAFAGLTDDQERADLVAFLLTLK